MSSSSWSPAIAATRTCRSPSPRRRRPELPIVIVGAGSEQLDEPEDGVFGLGRVTDAELCWVYRNAAVVIGAGREDFGLTVIEATLEGTPAATVAAGGYLETVRPGRQRLPRGIRDTRRPRRRDPARTRARRGRVPGMGTRIQSRRALARLGKVMEEVVQRA